MLATMEGTSDLLTPLELAGLLRVKVGTLYSWRSRHVGPPAVKICGGVRYRRWEVEAWLAKQAEAE
jgi:predicted DNA-binding transcriptional regulator AlpA